MREILYQGKCIDKTCLKGQWVDGQILHDGVTGKYYIHMDNCLNESDNVGEEGLLRFVAYEVDPKTVCQYTGKSDYNLNKIWEEDFVRINDEWIGRIIWRDDVTAFCVFPNDDIEHETYCLGYYIEEGYKVEVIGNIFDNPELIGGANE